MDPDGGVRKASALLVDDGMATGANYMGRLEREGYRVTRTSDPAAGLSFAKQSAPRVIFVNIGRGGSGSSTFLHALRSNDQTRHIPVSILSSYYDPARERLGLTLIGGSLW
jgi:twitching motility two-component system response regulator PilH